MDTSTATLPTSVSLSIEDLTVLANAMDLACQRGAFRASEMSSVGNCFDKLQKFLAVALAAQEQQGA